MRLRQTRMRKRGEIWLADLNPRRGTKPGKTRPVLIIQAQALIDAGHPSTLIIPLTTQLIDDAEPLRLRVQAQGTLRKDSDLLVDQLRAIDYQRLVDGPLSAINRPPYFTSPSTGMNWLRAESGRSHGIFIPTRAGNRANTCRMRLPSLDRAR